MAGTVTEPGTAIPRPFWIATFVAQEPGIELVPDSPAFPPTGVVRVLCPWTTVPGRRPAVASPATAPPGPLSGPAAFSLRSWTRAAYSAYVKSGQYQYGLPGRDPKTVEWGSILGRYIGQESVSMAEQTRTDGFYVDSWRVIECTNSQFCGTRMRCRWYISSGRFAPGPIGCTGLPGGPLMPC